LSLKRESTWSPGVLPDERVPFGEVRKERGQVLAV